MEWNERKTRALVLGAGGITGIAWELGILMGLYDTGIDVREVDVIIGTSAGSAVGAMIANATDLENLFATQLTPLKQLKNYGKSFNSDQMMEEIRQAKKDSGSDSNAVRVRIGSYALTASSISEQEWLGRWKEQLPVHQWSHLPLRLVTVDIKTGEEYIIDKNSGVPLVNAVAASCAMPGVFPPVTIEESQYMDGGLRGSVTNADLANGYNHILILSPMGLSSSHPEGISTLSEAETLQQEGSQVLAIEPNDTIKNLIEHNPFDSQNRRALALAGRTQGQELALSVAKLFS